jgi:hypothetical protein
MLYLVSYLFSTDEERELLRNLQRRKSLNVFPVFSVRFYIEISTSAIISLTADNCILLELRKIAIRIGLDDCGSVFEEYLSNNEGPWVA